MNTVSIIEETPRKVRRKDYRLPEKWEEVTRRQFSKFARAISRFNFRTEAELYLAYKLTGMKKRVFEAMVGRIDPDAMKWTDDELDRYIDEMDQLTRMAELLDWMFEELSFNKSFVPSFCWIFRGPKSHLRNLIFEEFIFADKLFSAYSQDPENEKALNLFIGTLYRPFAIPFNKHLIETWSFFARFLPKWKKKAIYMNYTGLRKAFLDAYPHLCEGGEEDPESDLRELIFDLAGPKFGTDDQAARKDIDTIFSYLNKVARERKRQKAQSKKR